MFKVGDHIVCIDPRPGLTLGKTYVVCGLATNSARTGRPRVPIANNNGFVVRLHADRFIAAKVTKAVPTARANDPATSKGKRKVNKYEEAILAVLRASATNTLPEDRGWTGKELAIDTRHPLNCITPRFAPLRRKGLIKDSGIKHDKQIVWVLA